MRLVVDEAAVRHTGGYKEVRAHVGLPRNARRAFEDLPEQNVVRVAVREAASRPELQRLVADEREDCGKRRSARAGHLVEAFGVGIFWNTGRLLQ